MSEPHPDGQVEAFFATFAAASHQLDTDRLAELFAETFLAADPAGVQPVPRQAFLHALPRRAELFRAAGTGASLPVRLSSTFILRREEDRLRVVFYLNHQDLTRLLSMA